MRVSAKFELFWSALWWLDALKRIGKIIRENAFGQKKQEIRVNLQTTGSRGASFDLAPGVQKVDKAIH